MKVNPADILPTQDYLKPETIKYIIACINDGNESVLPPPPIVRAGQEGSLLAIDGHNLIAVRLALGQEVAVHVARSKHDGLQAVDDKDKARNVDLLNKYDKIPELRQRTVASGVDTFQDLIDRSQTLKEIVT